MQNIHLHLVINKLINTSKKKVDKVFFLMNLNQYLRVN